MLRQLAESRVSGVGRSTITPRRATECGTWPSWLSRRSCSTTSSTSAGRYRRSIIAGYGMTFPFYVYISVVGNAVGAFGSLAAGLADRWGRANLVAYGLVITALLALFGIPNAHDKWTFAILFRHHRPRRGRHPRRHPGPGQGLLAAARPGLGDGLLDTRPGRRQPRGRRGFQQHGQPPGRLAGPVHHLRHRRARRRRRRAVRAQGAVAATARPAHGVDAGTGRSSRRGLAGSTSRSRCAARGGR